jgi:hypothetical protein
MPEVKIRANWCSFRDQVDGWRLSGHFVNWSTYSISGFPNRHEDRQIFFRAVRSRASYSNDLSSVSMTNSQ